MCGIAGYWSSRQSSKELALIMAEKIQTRGPDDAGAWLNYDESLALSHRRLAIVDLSPAGHQPMVSSCGQYAIAFNGEIYNHEDLRLELEGELGGANSIAWKGHSDTEVLLRGLQHWGIELTLSKLNGMFAFAYWDETKKTLFLARDRMGEKPLYFGRHNGAFIFGSELKALKAHPEFKSDINRDALALYMRHNYIAAPYCIYNNTFKLKPAHYLVVTNKGENISEQLCYWELKAKAEYGLANQITDEKEALSQLDSLLKDSIKRRMMADVPLGAFLSGGYDSTTVAALMQAQSDKPVKTFSIGFKEDAFNEAHYAKQVAQHLGTEHTELYVAPQQALDVIPKLPTMYDEPFSDSSQVPTYLVSHLAKQHVTVALSGDGGDELFCGYGRYATQSARWNYIQKVPSFVKPTLAISLELLSKVIHQTTSRFDFMKALVNTGLSLSKVAHWLKERDIGSFYRASISHFTDTDLLVRNSRRLRIEFDSLCSVVDKLSSREHMMLFDTLTYLPGDILTKVDRASMAVSLEARVPLLDHRLVEFAWRLPIEIKTKNDQGKWPLRQVVHKYVPEEIMDRPKQGFGVPIGFVVKRPASRVGGVFA